RRRVQRIRNVGARQADQVAGLRRMARPDAGVAVGLQLGPDGAALGALRLRPLYERAQQVLHVVAVLVREHVRLGERPASRPESRLELVEEAEVDVDVLVYPAVKGTDVGRRLAAAGARRAGEEDRCRGNVLTAGEGARPVRLDAVDVADDS